MKRLFLLSFLAVFLMACVQPSDGAPTAIPTAAATLAATPTPMATETPTVEPTTAPSPSLAATPVANASSVPTLHEAALRLEPVLNAVFNASRLSRGKNPSFALIAENVWAMGALEGDYVYDVTFSNARYHWLPEDLLDPAVNASGVENGYLSYGVGESDRANIMKCYGQRYEINLNLKSYSRTWSALDYQPLMRQIMPRLVDACPP